MSSTSTSTASASASASAPTAGPVTLVTQTRVRPEAAGEFTRWQLRIGGVVAGAPGFVDQEVIPPSPPVQPDWVIVQRFASVEAARAWLGSAERGRLIEQAQPWLVGQDDVHLVRGGDEHGSASPVSAVISTLVEPGKEEVYREWQRKIAAVQARSPGFQGYKLEPPLPGVQDAWVTILRFASEADLQTWLDSPERQRLVAESAAFTGETRIRTVRSGFDQWFRSGEDALAPSPPAWQQNMLVVLALYPVVFLFGKWVQTPLLMERIGMPFWLALFFSNVASVVLLGWLVPWVRGRFGWWLAPEGPDAARTKLVGAALVVALYGLCLLAFWRYP